MLGSVDDLEDKRALRLVCKRTCASVDRRVVAVVDTRHPPEWREALLGERQLSALVRAPWQLQRLDLYGRRLGDEGVATLATARWPALQVLRLDYSNLGVAGVASLAAWPALQELGLEACSLGDAGVASLAAAPWHALQKLNLSGNWLSAAGAASLAAAPMVARSRPQLFWKRGLNDPGRSALPGPPGA